MVYCRWLLGWGSVFVVVSQFIIGLAQAAPPPLKPNEEIVKTKDGCGMVIDKTNPGATYVRQAFSNLTWGGACIDGLAMGEGLLSAGYKFPDQPAMLPLTGWVWYGRLFGSSEQRWDNGSAQKNFTWEGRTVFYKTFDASKPVWSKIHAESSTVSDGEIMVSTMMLQKPTVFVTDIKNSKSQQHSCPDASPANCQALWAQHAGPVIERIKTFLAENEPKAKARMAEVQPLVAAWKAKVGSAVVAKREADAKRGAGEQFDKQAKKAEWDKGCWDKLNKAPTLFDPGPASENNTKRARYLQTLFKGECAGHHYAENGLKEADQLLAKVPELQKQEGVTAKYEKEQKEQREKDRKETAEVLGKVAGAVLGGKNSKERKENVINALGGGPGGGVGAPVVAVLNLEPIPSRAECIKVRELQLPVPQSMRKFIWQATDIYFEQGYRPDDRRVSGTEKMVVLENTCDEPLVLHSAACFEYRTNVAGSGQGKSWGANEFMGSSTSERPGLGFQLVKLPKGYAHFIGDVWKGKMLTPRNDGVKPPSYDSSNYKRLAQIAYGAWPDTGWYMMPKDENTSSAAGLKLIRRGVNLYKQMGLAYYERTDGQYGFSMGRHGTPISPETKPIHECSVLDMKSVWDSTQ